MKYKPEVKSGSDRSVSRGDAPSSYLRIEGNPAIDGSELDARHRICGGDTDQMRGMW